jgi:hypothetical protein
MIIAVLFKIMGVNSRNTIFKTVDAEKNVKNTFYKLYE